MSRKQIHVVDELVIWIVCISLCAVLLLSLHKFSSAYAILAGTVLCAVLYSVWRPKLRAALPPRFVWLGLFLLLALCFRAKPYLWIMGFQDPGTYVNMAAHYEQYGSTFITDSFRERLSTDEKIYYDGIVLDDLYSGLSEKEQQYNYYPKVTKDTLARFNATKQLGYTAIIPGVYLKNLAKSEYVFQFYPVHPIWMAMFNSLFGKTNGVYSLPFFALMTIIMFYRLAKVLAGGDDKVGLIAAGLLAINPLHAFFSKFPVTEVCFLFFTVSGFYYLSSYVHDREKGGQGLGWRLPLSVALFLCAFLTRVTGFLYMPFFYLLAVSLYITNDKTVRGDRKRLFIFCLAVMGVYCLSVLYGLKYSFPYTMEQFSMSIGKKALRGWWIFLPISFLALIILPVVAKKILYRFRWNDRNRLFQFFQTTSTSLMFLILALGTAIACVGYVKNGFPALMSSTVIVAISYISPVAFLLMVFGFYFLKKLENVPVTHVWLIFFITLFWGLYIPTVKIHYQYYYARYLLAEVVPFSLLFVAIYLGKMLEMPGSRRLAQLCISCMVLYSLYYTSFQFNGREADGAYDSLVKVAQRVRNDDVLFVTFNDFKLLTPLRYFFDLNTFRVEEADIKEKAGNTLLIAHNAYILAKNPVQRRGANLVEVIDYRQGQFEHVQRIPTKFEYVDKMKLYFYQIDRQVY